MGDPTTMLVDLIFLASAALAFLMFIAGVACFLVVLASAGVIRLTFLLFVAASRSGSKLWGRSLHGRRAASSDAQV